ncbi:Uncharacterised protein [Serratia marcescens]|nr:Uncharacterised protein [Serratia marcescens]
MNGFKNNEIDNHNKNMPSITVQIKVIKYRH